MQQKISSFFKIIFVLFFVVIIVALIGILVLYFSIPSRYNILIIGSDQRADERARSDVLMVFSIPKDADREPVILTIPRDTRVDIPGHGTQKITHAYALGDRKGDKLGNPDLTKETVEEFLNIKIDAAVEITFAGFMAIINRVGGVDTSGGHFDGEAALLLVRNRLREGGDFARTQNQREIFTDLMKKIKESSAYGSIYNNSREEEELRIDYPLSKTVLFFSWLFWKQGGFPNFSKVQEEVIPGQGENIYTQEFGKSLYYWVPDLDATKELVDAILR